MEKEKKFSNLPAEYRNYLDEINKVLINYDLNKNYSFKEINSMYQTINDINEKKLILEKDIERLFKNYQKTNETIYKLRKLLRARNKEIIRNLLKSEIYKEYLKKLSNENKKNINDIEKVIIEIIKKYAMTWKCCWSFLEIDDNGRPKKIELFDINDIKYFKEKLNIN